jgi:hypothetical protein
VAIAIIVGFIYAGKSGWIFAIRLALDGVIALLWTLGCLGIGMLCWDSLLSKLQLNRTLRISGSFALGTGIVSLATLLLGLLGALNTLTTWGMMALGLVVILLHLLQAIRAKSLSIPSIDPWLLPLAGIVGIVLVACFVPPGALWADAEPNGYDVVEYHFQIPREWYESGVIEPLRHNVYSYFPFGIEMHYLLAMHLNGGPFLGMYVAQLMHAMFIAMSVVATAGIAIAMGRSGTLAMLASGVCPWLLLLAPIGFNEGGLLLYGVLAIGMLILSSKMNSIRAVAAAGIFAGFACGVKLTAVPMVVIIPILAMLCLKATIARREVSLGALAMYGVISIGVFSPWLIRNLVWIGNPVFPEATSILGKAYFSDEQVVRWNRAHTPPPAQQSIAARVKAAKDQILLDWRFAYVLLPLSIFSLALLRRREDIAIFVMLAMMLAFWLAFTHLQGRFFVLMIPLTSLVIAGLPWKRIIASMLLLAGVAGWVRWQLTYYRDDNPNKGTIARSTANGVLGLGTLDVLKIIDLSKVPEDRVVVLVGDGNPFWFSSIPMSRLRYRTVFDVDAHGRGPVEAWCDWIEPLPSDAVIVIDPMELDRFSQTYGTPPLDAKLYRDGTPYILDR